MKKIYLLSIFVLAAMVANSQSFTPNNLVVTRVGDGSTSLTTGNTAPISLLEFTTTGVNQASAVTSRGITGLTISGNVNEGQLSLSSDRNFLSLAGYSVAAGELFTSKGVSNIPAGAPGTGYSFATPPTVTISTPQILGGVNATASANITSGGISSFTITNSGSGYTAAPTVTISGGSGSGATAGTVAIAIPFWQGFNFNKVIARIGIDGVVGTTTSFQNSSFQSNGSVKGAVSVDGSSFYLNGGRVEYATFGQTTPSTLIFSQNSRSIGIHGNQLYFASGFSTTPIRFTNTALPTSSVAATNVPGITTNHDLCSFSFLNMNSSVGYLSTGWDLLYIAKFNNGLEKWYFDGTTWVLAGNYSGAGTALSSIAVNINSLGQPVIYAITGNNTGSNNSLVAITDMGGRTDAISEVLPTINTSHITLANSGAGYGFRGVAFTPTSTVLPITLTTFSGSLINNAAALRWSTASESNSKEFVIERSNNGVDFKAIGTVSTTNTNNTANYSFQDASLLSGDNYYRLKMVDNDGTFEYSKNLVAVKLSLSSTIGVLAYPNPTNGPLTINHGVGSNKGTITIIDLAGKKVAEFGINVGNTQTEINVSNLPAGNYFININNDGIKTLKLIKN
jgi:hypothetical protein